MKSEKLSNNDLTRILLICLVILFVFNQYLLFNIGSAVGVDYFKSFQSSNIKLTGDLSKDAQTIILSQGVPDVYGAELGVEFINPSQTQLMDQMIAKMGQYDPAYGSQKIVLSGDLKQRYTDIGLRISCEFCCGAKSIVFSNGEAACGCAHSQAMRGLTAYLLQNHGTEYTNDQILRELSKWKALYFPKQMMNKLVTQLQSGQFTPDISALLLDVDKNKLLKNAGQGDVPLPSDINNLPSMAGDC